MKLLVFQNLREVCLNIQNGSLHQVMDIFRLFEYSKWQPPSSHVYFPIAINPIIYIQF